MNARFVVFCVTCVTVAAFFTGVFVGSSLVGTAFAKSETSTVAVDKKFQSEVLDKLTTILANQEIAKKELQIIKVRASR